MYTNPTETMFVQTLIDRYGEPITQFLLEEIARADRRDTPAAIDRASGMGGRHGD